MTSDRFHATANGGAQCRCTFRFLAILAVAVLLGSLIGCGSDDDDNGGGGTSATSEQQMEESLAGLAQFGAGAIQSPEASVIANPAVSALLSSLGLEIPSIEVLGMAPGDVALAEETLEALVPHSRGLLAKGATQDCYGTYRRDRNSTSEPFPGWVMETPNVPDDGFIFAFPADSMDVYYIDYETGHRVAVRGEIRFLEIVPDICQYPDAEITSMVFELALAVGEAPLALAAHISYEVEYFPGSEDLSMVRIGDIDHVTQGTFIGDMAFAFSYDATIDGAYIDVDMAMLIVDMSFDPDYVIGWSLVADNYNLVTELPESATITFGYGATNDHTSPPWQISGTFDNFRGDPEHPDDYIVDVSGAVTASHVTLATFAGDTREVPVAADVDGDGDIDDDDTCMNIDITIDGHTDNICVVFIEIMSELPDIGIGALFAGPYCHCGAR